MISASACSSASPETLTFASTNVPFLATDAFQMLNAIISVKRAQLSCGTLTSNPMFAGFLVT